MLALASSSIVRPSQIPVSPFGSTATALGTKSALPGLGVSDSEERLVSGSKMPSGSAARLLSPKVRISSFPCRSKVPGSSAPISLLSSWRIASSGSMSKAPAGTRAIALSNRASAVSPVSGSSTPGAMSVSALFDRRSDVTCPSPAKSPGFSAAMRSPSRFSVAGIAASAAASMSAQLDTPAVSATSFACTSRVRSQIPPVATAVRPSTFVSTCRTVG